MSVGVLGPYCFPLLTDSPPAPGFDSQDRCLSPACLHIPYVYSSWGVSGKGIWLCPSIHSNSCVDHIMTALPGRPQGPPAMLTYIPKLPHMVFAAGRLDGIEQMDWVVDVARTSSPWGPTRHCCVGELLQPVPEENCGTTHVGAATKGQKLHWLWINYSEQQR